MSKVCAVFIGVSVLAAGTTASAQNLVTNGNFESGSAGWTNWRANWGTGETWDFTNTEAGRIGAACLNLRINGTSSFGVYQQIAVTPGKTYKIDGYWKGKRFGNDNWAEIMLLDGAWDPVQADTGGNIVLLNHMYAYDSNPPAQPFTADFGWVWGHDQNGTTVDTNQRNGLRTASGNVMTIVLKAGACCGTTQASVWFDDISLVENEGGNGGGGGKSFTNGNFDNGMDGWTPWAQNNGGGTFSASVVSGEMAINGQNYNGGVYQQFNTGGAGTVVNLLGDWRSTPTQSNAMWGEVLVINADRVPANGVDETNGANNAILLFKNDTFNGRGAWNGPMGKNAPVTHKVSFVAAGSKATIILKAGSNTGSATGVNFDNLKMHCVPQPATVNSLPAGFVKRTYTFPSSNINCVSIAQNPISRLIYAVRNENGDTLYRINVDQPAISSTAITNLGSGSFTGGAQGITFDNTGNMYVSSKNGDVLKGIDTNPDPNTDSWSFSQIINLPEINIGTFHGVGGLAVGPDNMLYINSGSESFYGYLGNGQLETFLPEYNPQTGQGFWNARILRSTLTGGLNNIDVFAEGIRNSFDITFRLDGKLFGVENGPNTNCEYAEEFNLIEEGDHYGFPYKYGSDVSGSDSSMSCQNSGGGNQVGPPALPNGITPRGAMANYGPDSRPNSGQPGYSNGGEYYGFHPHSSPNGVDFYEPSLMDAASIKFPSEFHGRAFVARFGQLETNIPNWGRDVVSLRLDDPSEGFLCNTFLQNMGRAIDVLCAYNGKLYVLEFDQTTSGAAVFGSASRIQEIAYTIPADEPNILLSPTTVAATADAEVNPPNGSFDVTNNGGGTLNYTITDDADWLSVSPTSGDNNGELDPISLIYDVAGLGCGNHVATVTVNDPNAINLQATVTVTLTIKSVLPDFDCDQDVDQSDWGFLQRCYSASLGTPPPFGCEAAAMDLDVDVDIADAAIFFGCYSGAGIPADLSCDDAFE